MATFPQCFRQPTTIVKYNGETDPRVWLNDYRLACQLGGATSDEVIIRNLPLHLADSARTWLEHLLLTPKFGKESDLWVRFDKESVWWKEGYVQRYSAKRSAVGYLLRFGKGTVELILRDWTVTWLNQGRRMDGYAIKLRDKLGNESIRSCTQQGINMTPECM
jgi:hypothetical protein